MLNLNNLSWSDRKTETDAPAAADAGATAVASARNAVQTIVKTGTPAEAEAGHQEVEGPGESSKVMYLRCRCCWNRSDVQKLDFLEAEPEGETVEAFADSGSSPSKSKPSEVEPLEDDLFLEADEELDSDDDFLDDKKSSKQSKEALSDDDIDDFLSDI